MSTITTQEQTGNKLVTTYDVSKFALGDNYTITGNLTAAGGNGATLQGMVMGRVSATGLLTPLVATATDGSQYPVGVCMVDKTIADGVTDSLTLINKGKVASAKLNFLGAETLDTEVGIANNKKTIRDWLNDLGLILDGGTELTGYDNL